MTLHQRTLKTRLLKGMCKLATGLRETISKFRFYVFLMFIFSYLKNIKFRITEMLITPYAKIGM